MDGLEQARAGTRIAARSVRGAGESWFATRGRSKLPNTVFRLVADSRAARVIYQKLHGCPRRSPWGDLLQ